MQILGKFTVKAPIQTLWNTLLEPETIGTCLPGAEKVEKIDEKTYDTVVKQKVGPIKVKLAFRNVLTVVQPPTHMELVGEGEDMTKLGHIKQKTTIDLKDLGNGEVEVSYESEVDVVGKLAMFGDRIMKSKAKDVEKEFTKNLAEKLRNLT
ncbi:MAG: SRPBCC domain-containing protein [Syntrophorhabdaceae bacterium]|jgi:carbon monoxide dehydrogenase subunit G|nr:SRPBCC domain-containing protein [Syntrophorhabdaceae bacterium]MDD5243418.1 SRPBCC domain-containing protein [Syntrophorhabdaceae bacterium]